MRCKSILIIVPRSNDVFRAMTLPFPAEGLCQLTARELQAMFPAHQR